MFGLFSNETKNTALLLKKQCEIVVLKYMSLSRSELKEKLLADFPDNQRHVDDISYMSFIFSELPEFNFSLEIGLSDPSSKNLSVMGHGKYSGFMLQVTKEQRWHCSARDGAITAASGSAKKLAQTLEKECGIRDMTAAMNRLMGQ